MQCRFPVVVEHPGTEHLAIHPPSCRQLPAARRRAAGRIELAVNPSTEQSQGAQGQDGEELVVSAGSAEECESPGNTEISRGHAVDSQWRNRPRLFGNSLMDMIPLAGPGPADGAAWRTRCGGGSVRGPCSRHAGQALRVTPGWAVVSINTANPAFTRPAAVTRREFPPGTEKSAERSQFGQSISLFPARTSVQIGFGFGVRTNPTPRQGHLTMSQNVTLAEGNFNNAALKHFFG